MPKATQLGIFIDRLLTFSPTRYAPPLRNENEKKNFKKLPPEV